MRVGSQAAGGWGAHTPTAGALSRPAGSLSAATSPPALSPDRFIRTAVHAQTHTDTLTQSMMRARTHVHMHGCIEVGRTL